ncbi:MAG: dicarboxylate/amino acid:cation symporter [Flavobacteriales bacterium]|nr:dicarboxylate/amino acid:cation symporter [Flavobacteriales bacterium]
MSVVKRIPLYVQILAGMGLGIAVGLLALGNGLQEFVIDWIKPFGTIFMKLLKLIAMPLVLASLITGIVSLKDITRLSRMGGKTLLIYITTTVIAISLGLSVVNVIRPGEFLSQATREQLKEQYATGLHEKLSKASETIKNAGPLQFLEDMVPENIVLAASDTRMMLQVIFFAVMLGIALILIPAAKSQPLIHFFDALNEAILKMVDIIMLFAPVGVMALIAGVMVDVAGNNPASVWQVLYSLLMYSITVMIGLLLMLVFVYPSLIWMFAKRFSPLRFYRAISPAQLMAFSTSSSAAALPVTIERVEEHLGVSKEVSGFVLPLGATINMDGTSLYQAVATVFIAQAYGIDLNFSQQLTIIFTATLASIGSAAVPGAGLVMLIIVLNSVGLDPTGIALVMAPDRLLDMMRTTVNVTSDCAVATMIASSENGRIKMDNEIAMN